MSIKIYNLYEVCEILSVSRKTVKKYINLGELKAIRLGNQLRVTEESLNNFIANKQIKVLRRPIDDLKQGH